MVLLLALLLKPSGTFLSANEAEKQQCGFKIELILPRGQVSLKDNWKEERDGRKDT
jgi:hypothetical protein